VQRQYNKIEEEANVKEKYQKYRNVKISEKIKIAKETIATGGFRSLYERGENYIIPFTIARLCEGFVLFPFMRFCLDILKLDNPFYLLTGFASFFVNLAGAFCLKFFGDVIRERKNAKAILAHVSPSNIIFWKQFEVELGHYHAFGLLQSYIQLFTFWYFEPGFIMKIVLLGLSRIIAGIICYPLLLLVNWSLEYDYDIMRTFRVIVKRDGKLGLFAGVKDLVLNEMVFSVVMVSGTQIISHILI